VHKECPVPLSGEGLNSTCSIGRKMLRKKSMDKIFFAVGILLFILSVTPLFSAEVSEQQDIAIFGLTYYSYDVPTNVLGYVDSSINHVFVNLKRFNVLGYGDYRLESKDIDEFVQRIRELQTEKVKDEGTYDEKFGTIVIKGEDFDRIVNSFIVVLPSLSNYNVGIERKEVTSGSTTYVVSTYVVDIVIDLTFVNVKEGTQEESLRITGSGSDQNIDRAGSEAVDNAISALSYTIKQIDMFKIKSGVIRVRGDRVFFELGSNIGVKSGDEYQVMTKQEIGSTGRIAEFPTGLIRVKRVYPDITEAQIVIQREKITEGDQLVEVAKLGMQISFYTGIMKVDIPDMDYDIILVDDGGILPPLTSYYFISLNQAERKFAPLAGLTIEKSFGYRFKGIFDAAALLNFPLFGGIGEFGVGTAFHKRRASLELSALGGILYMTSFKHSLDRYGILDDIMIEGTTIDFAQDPVINIYGLSLGVKGGTALNYLIKPNFSLRLGLNYRLYTPITNWKIHIEETSRGAKESVDIRSDSPNIIENEDSGGMKRVSISGYEVRVALTLRF